MNQPKTICLLLLCGSLFTAQIDISLAETVDESKQPSISYNVVIDGKSYETQDGQPLAIKGTLTNPSVVIKAGDSRRFSMGGLSFSYPADYLWEAEVESDEYKNWTLSGNSLTIMYFRLNAPFTPEAYAKSMLDRFEGKATKDTELKLGAVTLQGKSFTIISGGIPILNYALTVPLAKGSGLLVFQDSDSKDGSFGKEATQVVEKIAKSFEIAAE